MISDGADPAVITDVAHRPVAATRPSRSCTCGGPTRSENSAAAPRQVDVVIVQAGQHGAARGVEHVFPAQRCQSALDVGDAWADPDVDDPAVQQRRRVESACAGEPFGDHSPHGGVVCAQRRGLPAQRRRLQDGNRCNAVDRLPAARHTVRRPPPSAHRSASPPPRRSDCATARAASIAVSGSAMASPQKTGPAGPAPTSPPATAASSPNAARSG